MAQMDPLDCVDQERGLPGPAGAVSWESLDLMDPLVPGRAASAPMPPRQGPDARGGTCSAGLWSR